jgi:hypothetical protein
MRGDYNPSHNWPDDQPSVLATIERIVLLRERTGSASFYGVASSGIPASDSKKMMTRSIKKGNQQIVEIRSVPSTKATINAVAFWTTFCALCCCPW